MAFSLRNLRFRCAISWIQSFYDDVAFPFPREVLSYPYTDLYTFTIRKELIWWLTKGDPYFCLISHLTSVPTSQLSSFEAVLSSLSVRGEELDVILLAKQDPFVVEQHLGLVEGIMGLCCATSLSLDCLSSQLRGLSGGEESVGSIEEGLVSWLQLVCRALRRRVHLDKNLVPEVSALSSCLSNGCLLLLLMHFYIPQCIQLSNGKFPPKPDDALGLEESFHNGTLVSNACMQIPRLKFCLSPQAIVRSADALLLPYLTVSLVSMFVCFELTDSDAIYRTPALYGALIGQAGFPSQLRSPAKFHSMDSVARRGSSSSECLPDRCERNRLITPSAEDLLASLHSNTSNVYPREGGSRLLSRYRTPVRAVKCLSTPELSRPGSGKTGILRLTQDLAESSVLKIETHGGELEIHAEEGSYPAPREAWSPVKQSKEVSTFPNSQEAENNCKNGSIPSRESVASLEPELDQNIETNAVIRLNIFPVAMETIPRNPISQLLKTGAIQLTADQSAARDTHPAQDPIRDKLGQLAFSYILTNQDVAFEEYICSQLGISSVEQISAAINNQFNSCKQTHIEGIIAIPFEESGNIVAEPQPDRLCSQTTQKPKEMKANSQEFMTEKLTKPLTFFPTGTDLPDSPFATEKAKNMLRMLEDRNTARQAVKNSAQSAKPKLQPVPSIPLVTPSASSHSLQSLNTNDIPIQPVSNHAHSTQRKPTRGEIPLPVPLPAPKHKSNKQIIKNAISDVCLAGGPNSVKKFEILSSLSECHADHFLILFRDRIGCKFRGLYAYSQEGDTAGRIGGAGPREVTSDMLVKLYKYNSGAKEFQEIPARSISSSIDAFTIQDSIWVAKKKRA